MIQRKRSDTAAETTHEDLDTVGDEIRCLREEVRVLRESIDEFREAFEHAVRNLPEQLPPPLRVWSMPADPTAPDFGERINAVPPEQMAALRASLQNPVGTNTAQPKPIGGQRRLF